MLKRLPMKVIFWTVALVASIILCGCASTGDDHHTKRAKYIPDEDWVVIAGTDGTDKKVQTRIYKVLGRKEIPCGMEGSLIYSVSVPKERAAEAMQLLHVDSKLKFIRLPNAELDIIKLRK